ncbi:MAG: hypothetical protein ACXAC7_12155 [Candidatus Hodarchaeales archaeon]|jgi:hypothetical protein
MILNVTNPNNIEEIYQYDDDGQSFSIFIQNDLIFVAEFSAGLEILQIDGLPDRSTTINSFDTNTLTSTVINSTKEEADTPSFNFLLVVIGIIIHLSFKKRK